MRRASELCLAPRQHDAHVTRYAHPAFDDCRIAFVIGYPFDTFLSSVDAVSTIRTTLIRTTPSGWATSRRTFRGGFCLGQPFLSFGKIMRHYFNKDPFGSARLARLRPLPCTASCQLVGR